MAAVSSSSGTKSKSQEKQNEDRVKFDTIVGQYLDGLKKKQKAGEESALVLPELEVRFGTMKQSAPLNKDNVTNIIKKLKSLQFTQSTEEYSLRIFLNDSDVRIQIDGFSLIQNFCIDNSIDDKNAKMITKKNMEHSVLREDGSSYKTDIRPVDNLDFDFRVSLQSERDIAKDERESIVSKWKSTEKNFRYIKRTTFTHPDYPVKIDISIVKDTFSSSSSKKSHSDFKSSNVMRGEDKYEVEIEVDNAIVMESGIGLEALLKGLRECIKLLLSGIQSSNFPISNDESRKVLDGYSKLLYGDVKPPSRLVFIGPSSVTLQIKNLAPIGKYKMPSIRKNYSVTDKADGLRKLLYISNTGRVYLIDPLMSVQFTGMETEIKAFHNTLIDGEHVLHDRDGNFINLYLAFDIYYMRGDNIRDRSFYTNNKEHADKSRYSEMLKYIASMDAKPVIKSVKHPFIIQAKRFYFDDDSVFGEGESAAESSDKILMLCKQCLETEHKYVTDGLIFTPYNTGVGGSAPGQVGPIDRKFTWVLSFKWKPPQFNTVDFLVNTVKDDKTNRDKIIDKVGGGIGGINGTNMLAQTQIESYKDLILKVGFDPSNRSNKIIPNACALIYEGAIEKMFGGSGEYKPIQFLPSNPYDVNAGMCQIKLNSEGDMVTEEGEEVFEDLTIVEFRYDIQEKKWIPLRIRHDKTADLRKTGKNFGNDYKTADSVWYSINYPVTENIIKGTDKTIAYEETAEKTADIDITEVYYKSSGNNRDGGLTSGLRDFHNKFVKSALIYELSQSGDTLIDFAVGKAGDLPKWKESRLSFVLGVDISRDNIENPVNGACTRYVNFVRENSGKMDALFLVGNSSKNIKDGSAFSNSSQLAREISNSVFGKGSVETLKKAGLTGVVTNYGKGEHGFDISSIQFAVHYMFETEETLDGFLRNICECTKKGGIFIGTTFNGKKVFELLKRNGIKKGESFSIFKSGDKSKKIVEIVKKYDDDLRFPPDENSLGYEIEVWQESINQYISEFLVNFDYFDNMMSKYGFEPYRLEKGDIFNKSRSSFEDLFKIMKQYHSKNITYSKACAMSNEEKTLSFLNDYFIYKKVRDVDCSQMKHAAVVVRTEKQKTFALHDGQGLVLTRLADVLVDHKWKQVDINEPGADFAYVGATNDAKKTGFLRYEESIYNIKTTLKNLLKGNGVKGYSTSDADYPYTKNVITDKAQLYIEMKKKCPEICKKYMAESWMLSDEKRTSEYSDADGVLIIKPLGVGAGGGEGIEYVTNKDELKEFIATHKKKQYLVSKYIRNPMLVEGKKFHLRMYFMVCMRPNKKTDWFLFEEGKIITAELPYKDADYKNKKIHDTHFKSTKKNRLFPESSDLEIGDKEVKHILQQMREILRCAYDVYRPHVATTSESKYGFEIFGCDFIVTGDADVKLLEINARHDYGVDDIHKENPEVYERFCSDLCEWIYKNAVEPIFKSDDMGQIENYESEHDRVNAVIEKGFPFVDHFWTKEDVEAAFALIKTKIAEVPTSALEKEHYIDNTSYNILAGNKETPEVNRFIREHIGANDKLKFKNCGDGGGDKKGEFISIKSPDEVLLDKDYLLVDYFTEPSKIMVRVEKGKPSLEEHFKHGTLVEKALRLLKRKSIEVTDESLHDIIMKQSDERTEHEESRINMKVSTIEGKDERVYLSSAENVFVYIVIWKMLFPDLSYEQLSNLKILDGAGGYGSRLMAAIILNAEYIGVEPNPLSTPGFTKMIEMFGSSEKQKMLEDGLPSALGVEKLSLGWADVVMFSPPMWGKEVYNDETVLKQSTNMFNNEKMWLKEFLHASIEVLWSRLRVGGFIVFQSVRYDYIGEHMIKEHVEKQKDACFMGILSRVTTAGRYKPNWVWQKTNAAGSTSASSDSSAFSSQFEEESQSQKEKTTEAVEEVVDIDVDVSVPQKPKTPKKIFVKNKTKKRLSGPEPEQ